MIRISNKIKTLLAMLSFVQVTSGCDATVQDIIIDTDPGVEIGNNDYYTWCKETLSVIDKDLKISGTHSYYENQDRSQVSFIWGNIFLLYTYTEGISLSKSEWSDALMNCFLNFDNYWHPNYKGIAGYATLPTSAEKVPDRFYDENGWTAIGLCDAYLATQNNSYLEKAKGALAFSLSGEDNVLGGGIYFQETFVSLPVQKNTICSAVTMLSCMKLYEITQDRQYLDAAIRINDWTVENLLDKSDNLLWDAKMVADGSVNTQKWSYNAGFMIRSWLKMYQATKDEKYLSQAKATLASSEAKWYNSINGALNDPRYFAFSIIDSWFDMYDTDKNTVWLTKAFHAINFIHNKLRDGNGRYPEHWGTPTTSNLEKYDLRFSTVAAYMYMRAANYKRILND